MITSCDDGEVLLRLETIDPNLFKVFDAIYRLRSVAKAAIVLNLTQPLPVEVKPME